METLMTPPSLRAQGPPPQDEPVLRVLGTFPFDDMTVQVSRTLSHGIIVRLDRVESGPVVEIATLDRWGFHLAAGVTVDSVKLKSALGAFLRGDRR
jgi:hypothetical protein